MDALATYWTLGYVLCGLGVWKEDGTCLGLWTEDEYRKQVEDGGFGLLVLKIPMEYQAALILAEALAKTGAFTCGLVRQPNSDLTR